jgi:hypothetical protein
MTNARTPEEDDFAVDSDYAPPQQGVEGPPEGWTKPSWFNRETREWWWRSRLDPCPAEPLGHVGGEYVFRTAAGEVRRFTSGQLHSSGGPSDLFGGEMWWPFRHFRKWDPEKGDTVGSFQKLSCMAAMIRACILAGYYDNAAPCRGVGTWGGPDGLPVVHAGDVIIHNGCIFKPGGLLGKFRYVIGARRPLPAVALDERSATFEWRPGSLADCHRIAAHLDEWHWNDIEGRDLYLGGLCCDMLGDALVWKPHRFVRAQAGSGKSALLKYSQALLGGAAHPIQRTYSKARLEQRFSHTSCALLLDELESDSEAERLRKVFELIRLLSDEGATGGRGTPGGQSREIDLHGTVTMVATLAEAWRPQDRSRIAYIELRQLRDRLDHPPKPPEALQAMIDEAAELSAAIRARVIVRFGLFQENLAHARARILELGGSPRDADQLGHLIAGWATMTSDEPLADIDLRELERFASYIMTVSDEQVGADDASDCFNTLLGLPVHVYRGGQQYTLGQVIALARERDGDEYRNALLTYGLRLDRQRSQVTGELETWAEAWLAVANKHANLEKLFSDYPEYRCPKRAQIISGLRRTIDGQLFEATASHGSLRFAGPQSRAWLIPCVFLPSVADDRQEEPAQDADERIEP